MKVMTRLFLLITLGALLMATGARANPAVIILTWPKPTVKTVSNSGTCNTIADADVRAHCHAKARKEPGLCYSIQAADRRAECLAEVRR